MHCYRSSGTMHVKLNGCGDDSKCISFIPDQEYSVNHEGIQYGVFVASNLSNVICCRDSVIHKTKKRGIWIRCEDGIAEYYLMAASSQTKVEIEIKAEISKCNKQTLPPPSNDSECRSEEKANQCDCLPHFRVCAITVPARSFK